MYCGLDRKGLPEGESQSQGCEWTEGSGLRGSGQEVRELLSFQ